MIPVIVQLRERIMVLEKEVAELKKDSHPPKPSLDASDFERWKTKFEEYHNLSLRSMGSQISVLQTLVKELRGQK